MLRAILGAHRPLWRLIEVSSRCLENRWKSHLFQIRKLRTSPQERFCLSWFSNREDSGRHEACWCGYCLKEKLDKGSEVHQSGMLKEFHIARCADMIRTVVLKLWSLDRRQHHAGACLEHKFLVHTPDLLHETLGWGPAICILISCLGGLMSGQAWEPLGQSSGNY